MSELAATTPQPVPRPVAGDELTPNAGALPFGYLDQFLHAGFRIRLQLVDQGREGHYVLLSPRLDRARRIGAVAALPEDMKDNARCSP